MEFITEKADWPNNGKSTHVIYYPNRKKRQLYDHIDRSTKST